MDSRHVIAELAEIYPQLYLDPDKTDREVYRDVVLAGQDAGTHSLDHFRGDPRDTDELIGTPSGDVRVITLHDRSDFEVFMRIMMAAKDGPLAPVPATQGAGTLFTINWQRIHAHREEFMKEQRAAGIAEPDWDAEFALFTSDKKNYRDMLVVLSCGPYSNVDAAAMGLPEEEWLEQSVAIRKYHELTHVVCRRLWPDKADAVWDELVADAVGIYASRGHYDRKAEETFLGIRDGTYAGGRLENYTDDAASLAGPVSAVLERFEEIIADAGAVDWTGLIPVLEGAQDELAGALHAEGGKA